MPGRLLARDRVAQPVSKICEDEAAAPPTLLIELDLAIPGSIIRNG